MSSPSSDPSCTASVKYLLQFASCEHAQFRFAEFASLAGMFDCRFATVYTGLARDFPDGKPFLSPSDNDCGDPQQQQQEQLEDWPTNAGVHDWRGTSWDQPLEFCVNWWRTRPVVVLRCDDESKLSRVVKRSALVKRLLRVWHSGEELAEVLDAVAQSKFAVQLAEANRQFAEGVWSSWRMCVELVNVSVAMETKVNIVEQFGTAGLEMPGRVDLKRPEFELFYLEHWRYDLTAGGVTDSRPVRVYLAPKIASGGTRAILPRLCLSRRVFIGNTSMNVQLAFVMCNLARVARGQLAVDPFVGSGSILVSAGYLGAYCVGQDVDYNIVLGLGKSTKAEMRKQKRTDGECISANFAQYGIGDRYADCLVGDASQHMGLWRQSHLFDAVLTDPPYGIRERSRKVKRDPLGGPKKPDREYFPPKEHYSLGDSLSDLLNFAAIRLTPGGRCVFWFPVIQSEYKGAPSLPCHPSFRLIASVELPMTLRTSRVLVCLQRLPADDLPGGAAGADANAAPPPLSEVAVGHDHHQLRSSHFSGGGGHKFLGLNSPYR